MDYIASPSEVWKYLVALAKGTKERLVGFLFVGMCKGENLLLRIEKYA